MYMDIINSEKISRDMSYTHKNLAHSHALPGLMLVQVLLIYTLRETVFEEQTYEIDVH